MSLSTETTQVASEGECLSELSDIGRSQLLRIQGEFTPLLAEKVAYSLKSVGRPSKKTTEMQQLPHQSQAEILGLLLGGHTIQNRTRVCSRNQKF